MRLAQFMPSIDPSRPYTSEEIRVMLRVAYRLHDEAVERHIRMMRARPMYRARRRMRRYR